MAQARTAIRSTGWIDTLYRRTIPLPVVAFGAAVLTDWSYSKSANLMWSDWSDWLLLFGLVTCGAALMILALGVRDRAGADGKWLPLLVLLAAFVIEIVNFMIHMRDGWTAVVPTGMILTLVGAALTLVAAWLSRARGVEARS